MRTALLLIVLTVALPVLAQSREITPFLGWMEGGAVQLGGEDTDIDGAFTAGATLTFDRGPGRRLDFTYAHQSSEAELRDPFEPVIRAAITIDSFQLGGRVMLKPGERANPYLGITLGGTLLSGDLLLSASYGGGVDLRITPAVALRLDGRFYTTLGSSNAEIACSSDLECAGAAGGSTLTQFAATTGLVFRF